MAFTEEYWIDHEGNEIFCDGDAGVDVPNHSMVVISYCCELLQEALEAANTAVATYVAEIIGDYSHEGVVDCVAIRCQINDEIDHWLGENLITEDQADDIITAITEIAGVKRIIVETAFGHNDDPREYGLELGWIRIQGTHITIPRPTRTVEKRLREFIEEHAPYEPCWNIEARFGGSRKYISISADQIHNLGKIMHAQAQEIEHPLGSK